MKVNELMIGDWVKVTDDDTDDSFIGQVKAIDELENINVPEGEDVAYPYSIDCLEPIPLTPEILEKNGFSGEGYNMGIVGFSVEPIPDEKDGYEVFIWTDMCLQIKHGFTHLKKYIKYVHELQHAIRLCGIEKEIEI